MIKEEEKTMEKTKSVWKENEAPLFRWVLTIVVTFAIGAILSSIIQFGLSAAVRLIPAFADGAVLGNQRAFFIELAAFSGYYIGFVIAIEKIAKTSLRAFVLGADRTSKLDWKKEVLPLLGLMVVGMLLQLVPSIGKIHLRGLSAAEIIFVTLICCSFAWMQTTFEELVFRGIPLRMFCKNNLELNVKTMIIAVVTSALFMVAHYSNPEVQSVSGIMVVVALASYFFSGFFMFLADTLTGNLLPGIVMHFVNNMFCFILVGADVSASGGSSIWADSAASNRLIVLIQLLISVAPILIYLVLKRKNVSKNSSH